jgi:hypothetical protein
VGWAAAWARPMASCRARGGGRVTAAALRGGRARTAARARPAASAGAGPAARAGAGSAASAVASA